MAQSWERLAFLHWPVDTAALSAVLPPQIEPDEYEGTAWIGVTPFRAAGTRLRFTPPIPFVSSFPELNVRTYVTAGGKPGIWFMSLDTCNRPAVHVARRTYRCRITTRTRRCAAAGGGRSSAHGAVTRASRPATGWRARSPKPRPARSSTSPSCSGR
jgi:uncharacterized protein YqjF (DUF2071 family)